MPALTSLLPLLRLRVAVAAAVVAAVSRPRQAAALARSAPRSPRASSTAELAGGGDGVEAAVDVDHLAGRGREPVRQKGDARLGDGLGVSQVPAERCPPGPHVLETVEAGDASRR